jgi:hypothetical protein
MTFLRKLPLLFVACSLFISISLPVFAQGVVSGDEVCGASADKACNITHVKEITGNIFKVIISLGLPLLVVFVCYRFIIAWFQLNQGNANAYREAAQKAGNAILGFMIIVALMGGIFFAILRMAGVKTEYLDIFKNILGTSLVERAYAQAPYSNEGRNASPAPAPIPESSCNASNIGVACNVSGGSNANADRYRLGKCSEKDVGIKYYCRSDGAGAACPTGKTAYVTGDGTRCLPDDEVQKLIQASEEAYQNSAAGQINSIGSQSGSPSGSPGSSEGTANTNQQNSQNSVAAPVTTASDLNPTSVNSLYDFILNILRLVMRFFVFPALIAIWVWTGFSFVLAQGAPEALAKAKKLLLWATISTFIIFMIQAFMTAVSGTVQKVLSEKTESIERHL